jgi:hypothetical protein
MYPIGNGLNLAISGAIGVASIAGLFWMKTNNRKRDKVTPGEREELLSGLTPDQIADLEWKHPDWRWKP